jgi:hypothetical protein
MGDIGRMQTPQLRCQRLLVLAMFNPRRERIARSLLKFRAAYLPGCGVCGNGPVPTDC